MSQLTPKSRASIDSGRASMDTARHDSVESHDFAKSPLRINKYLAVKGYSTRKGADALISQGLVFINGRQAVLGDKVEEKDVVEVKGTRKEYRYYAYNKPIGIVTHSAQEGEKDIAMATSLKGVFPVGRLDKKSTGLIILTDDGRITDKLLNPEYEHEKEYRVTTTDELPKNFKKRMEAGVDIEGYVTKPSKIEIESDTSFTITLIEGKKHQIRRMCVAVGVNIETLERMRVMNIDLGTLKSGQHRELKSTELELFLKSLSL
ncbi:MAG: pseudouridine synthase [Patescibacteria group bacterium]